MHRTMGDRVDLFMLIEILFVLVALMNLFLPLVVRYNASLSTQTKPAQYTLFFNANK